MAERNGRNRRERSYRDNDYLGSRQAEQFEDTSSEQDYDTGERDRDQMGEGPGRQPRGFYYEEVILVPRRGRGRDRSLGRDDQSWSDEYEGGRSEYGPSVYDRQIDRGFQPFTSEDQGGGDFVRGGRRPSYGRGYDRGSFRANERYGSRGSFRHDDERGFFDKAGDEIASWFGDEDAARRREMDHRGRGPGNYTRSDERILEDACDSLTDDWAVDARNIQVTVKDAEVTLDGTVDSRAAKRRAEDCVDCISGVKHVQNNLRVQDGTGSQSGGTTAES